MIFRYKLELDEGLFQGNAVLPAQDPRLFQLPLINQFFLLQNIDQLLPFAGLFQDIVEVGLPEKAEPAQQPADCLPRRGILHFESLGELLFGNQVVFDKDFSKFLLCHADCPRALKTELLVDDGIAFEACNLSYQRVDSHVGKKSASFVFCGPPHDKA